MRLRFFVALFAVTSLGTLGVALLSGLGLHALGIAIAAGASSLVAGASIAAILVRDAEALVGWTRADPGAPPPSLRSGVLENLALALQRKASSGARAERALADESRTLSAAVDGLSEGFWITDANGTVLRHNKALERLVPAHARIDGERPLAILRSVELNEAVARACTAGVTSQLELEPEPERNVEVAVFPLVGPLPGSAAVFRDVTELRRLEQVRQDFVGNVSHELRTPITAIRGYAETLQSGALGDPEAAAKMVEIIHRQSVRLTELVEDLLELSRIEAGSARFVREPVRVADTAQRAIEAVRPKAEARGVRIVVAIPREVQALADDRALEQLMLNLLDNAVKYTASGGSVEVRAAVDGSRCSVTVADTGIGIEAKHLSRIFERFYRVDKGRSRELGGTGLGLAIVKHLSAGMGGEVKVDSEPGVGTTFTVTLPAALASEQGSG